MPEALLAVRNLEAFYGDFQALFGVSIEVARAEAVAVIGANGAGKSTLLKSIAGLLRARRDAIAFAGEPIGGMPAYAVAARGIALVPEGRGLFPSLSVEENLLIGGQLGRPGAWTLRRVYELFPGARRGHRHRFGRARRGAGARRRLSCLLSAGGAGGAVRRGERSDARGNRRRLFRGVKVKPVLFQKLLLLGGGKTLASA